MTIYDLSLQYRDSGQLCRSRMRELESRLKTEPMSETERIGLRRRICILDSMARDAMAIAGYLARYYRRGRAG